MIPKYVLAPFLGGVIGYITNDIAIKMLFHPRKSVYIGKFHVPFTPGLIPQQKDRIARSVGRVVSRQLLNSETLKSSVLSEETIEILRGRLRSGFESFADDERSLYDFLLMRFSQEQISDLQEKFCDSTSNFIIQKLVSAHIGSIIAQSIVADVQKVIPDSLLSNKISDSVIKNLSGAVEKVVENKLKESGPELLSSGISHGAGGLLKLRLCDIYKSQKGRLPQVVDGIILVYVDVLANHLDKLLNAVDLEGIIVKKVSAFSSAQLESMIFGILSKELKAIVYLGAALGFLMGFINLLF